MNDGDAVNLALLILRVAAGLMIFAHGWNHLVRVRKNQGVAEWFESLGLRPGPLHAWFVTLTELGAGPLLVAGLITPLAAGGLVGISVVAWITAHRKNGFFIFRPGQGWEYVMMLTVVGLAIGALGPGEWSLDHAIDLDWSGWGGLLTAAIAGIGGGLALLAVWWRPPRAEEAA